MPEELDARLARFEPLAPGAAVPPASPSEIRRRGDRRRRRERGLAIAAAALAVAVVATPLALLGGRDDDTETLPAGPAYLDRIPEDFPLSAGLPADDGDGEPVTTTDRPAVADLTACETTFWTPRRPAVSIDVAGASYSGEAEDDRARTLALYDDAADAEEALTAIREGYAGCPREVVGSTPQRYTQVTSELGGDSLVLTHTYSDPVPDEGVTDPGLEVLQFVRVGNALLLTADYSEGGGTEEQIASSVSRTAGSIGGVLDAMRIFDGVPDVEDPEDGSATLTDAALLEVEEIPARDRLAAWEELPDQGPMTRADAPTLACQADVLASLDAEAAVNREFGATLAEATPDAGLEPTRIGLVRETVLQYDAAGGAAAAYETVSQWVRGCTSTTLDIIAEAPRRYEDAARIDEVAGAGVDRSVQAAYTHQLTSVCDGECDALTFTQQAAVLIGDRVLLLQIEEDAGPLPPDDWGAALDELLPTAVARVAAPSGADDDGDGEPGPGSGSADPAGPGRGDIAADFPLAAGFPASAEPEQPGTQGPGADLDGPSLQACGEDPPAAPSPTGSLRARFDNVEDYRARELLTFADAETAVSWVAGLREFYESCPREAGEVQDFERLVLDRTLGGQSFATARFSLQFGQPAPGLELLQVVRVGRAVLLDSRASEAGGGPEGQRPQAVDAADEQAAASGAVVSAMCAFTEAGC